MFQAVAFISGEEGLSEREKSMVGRLIDRELLLLVMGSKTKSEELADFVMSRGGTRANVIRMHSPDSPYLLPYLAQKVDREGLVIDITFASPYYASAATILCRRPCVTITYTMWDGTSQVLFASNPHPSVSDDVMGKMMVCLMSGSKTLEELEVLTGLNYKTLARRASYLLRDGHISKTDERPIRYYLTTNQIMSFDLSQGADHSAEGKLFENAAEAVMECDEIILDNTLSQRWLMPSERPLP